MVSNKVKFTIAFCVVIALCEIARASPLEKIKESLIKAADEGRSKRGASPPTPIMPVKTPPIKPADLIYLVLTSIFFLIESVLSTLLVTLLSLPGINVLEPLLGPQLDAILTALNTIVVLIAESL